MFSCEIFDQDHLSEWNAYHGLYLCRLGYTWDFLDCLHEYQLKKKFIGAILESVTNKNVRKRECFLVKMFPTRGGEYIFKGWPNAEPAVSPCSFLRGHRRAGEGRHHPLSPLLGCQLCLGQGQRAEEAGGACGAACPVLAEPRVPAQGRLRSGWLMDRNRKAWRGLARSYHLVARFLPNLCSSVSLSVSLSKPVTPRL